MTQRPSGQRHAGLSSLSLLSVGQRSIVALIFLSSLGTALFTWWQMVDAGRQEEQARFERVTDAWRSTLVNAIAERTAVLRGAAGFWRTVPSAHREDWKSYLDGLNLRARFPDIDAMALILHVPAARWTTEEDRLRDAIVSTLTIHPKGDDGSDAFVVTHVEPHDRMHQILGFNLAAEARRKAAAEAARDSGQPVMTDPLRLLTTNKTSADALIFAPVYRPFFPIETVEQKRHALRGWVAMGLHVSTLLNGIVGNWGPRPLEIEVSGGGGPTVAGKRVILRAAAPPVSGALVATRVVEVAGQTWRIKTFSPTPGTSAFGGQNATTLAMAVGLALAMTIGAALLFVSRRQDQLLTARALAHSEARYRAMVDGTAEGYWRVDPATGLTVEVNKSLASMLGYAEDEMVGRPPTHFCTEEGAVIMLAQIARQSNTNHRLYDTTLRRKDGGIVIAHFSATTLHDADGRATTAFAFVSDITDRKRMEQELLDKTTALETSNANLQQFAYVASHDLQAPLRTISSFLQLLDRRYGEQLDATAREYIDFAVSGAMRMSSLVHDLLLFSRVETQGRELEPTDLRAAVRTAVENLTASITGASAEVTVAPKSDDPGPWVLGDAGQLTSLAQNLIENGLKYRRPGVPPTIRVGLEATPESVVLSVGDNGIGIPQEHHDRIFKIFQRLHTSDEFDGTGIGLALCRRITDRHGGSISVSSAEGQGTTFYVHLLPASPPTVEGEREVGSEGEARRPS